ncbi:hypothetical protein U3516DRAFT_220 [Neocallimastix sp. 'constans']
MSLLLKSIPKASFGLQNKILISSLSTKNPLNNVLCTKLNNSYLHLGKTFFSFIPERSIFFLFFFFNNNKNNKKIFYFFMII